MTFLVINSITHNCEFYLFIDSINNLLVSQRCELKDNKDEIVPFLENFLQENNLSLHKLDFISVVVGPGSYAGLRTSLALANALGFALKMPLVSINLFEILLLFWQQNNLLTENKQEELQNKITNAKVAILVAVSNNKGGFFVQLFNNNGTALAKATDLAEENFSSFLKNVEELHIITNSSSIDLQSLLQFSGKIFYKHIEISADLLKRAILKKYYANSNNKVPLEALYIKPPKITVKTLKIIKGN